jgi:hypothetical protein
VAISRKDLLTMVVIPIITAIASIAATLYVASMDDARLQSQFEQSLARQDERNRIMNETLTATLERLQKKSYIQVIVDPSAGFLPFEEKSLSWVVSNNNGTVTQTFQDTDQTVTKLGLVRNQTVSFSVVIANVGSNIARIDHITATVVPDERNDTLKVLSQEDMPIKQNLAPNGQPLEFTYSFNVTEDFVPSGQIIFSIYHDSDKRDYPAFTYEYFEENPFSQAAE